MKTKNRDKMRKQVEILSVQNSKGVVFKIGDKIKTSITKEVFKISHFIASEKNTVIERENQLYIMAHVKRKKNSSTVAINIDFADKL